MAKRKLIVAGTLLLAALAVCGCLLPPALRAPVRAWTLPDGSQLRLLQVTSGTNHLDLLYPLVPAAYRTNFGFQVARLSTLPPGSLVAWFEHRGVPPKLAPVYPYLVVPQRFGDPLHYSLSVVDTTGLESDTVTATKMVALTNGAELDTVVLSQYPRRSKTLNLRLYASPEASRLVGEFQQPNPAAQHPADWTAEPLPATRRTNDLEIKLVSLAVGPTGSSSESRWYGVNRSEARATFDLREHGQPTTNWSITRITVTNVLGESFQMSSLSNAPTPGAIAIHYPMWAEEPWKVRVELARTSGFAPEEIWTINDVGNPLLSEEAVRKAEAAAEKARTDLANSLGLKPEQILWDRPRNAGVVPTTTLNWPTNLPGALVASATVGPVPEPYPPSGRNWPWYPGPQFAFNLPDSIWMTILQVTDENRVVLRQSGSNMGPAPGSSLRTFNFSAPKGWRTVSATIGISRVYTVEFTVKPTQKEAPTPSRPKVPGR